MNLKIHFPSEQKKKYRKLNWIWHSVEKDVDYSKHESQKDAMINLPSEDGKYELLQKIDKNTFILHDEIIIKNKE